MPNAIRTHRVIAFCNWLDTVPPKPPFFTRPEYKFFADLSDGEKLAASDEMERRAEAASAEADALEAEGKAQFRQAPSTKT